MFTSKVDKKTQQEVNALLISGAKLAEVAAKTGLAYNRVHYFRKKLVKAGALQPLNKTTKRRTSRKTRSAELFPKTQYVATAIPAVEKTSQGINLVINGTELSIRDAKSINVSGNLVTVKY